MQVWLGANMKNWPKSWPTPPSLEALAALPSSHACHLRHNQHVRTRIQGLQREDVHRGMCTPRAARVTYAANLASRANSTAVPQSAGRLHHHEGSGVRPGACLDGHTSVYGRGVALQRAPPFKHVFLRSRVAIDEPCNRNASPPCRVLAACALAALFGCALAGYGALPQVDPAVPRNP